MRLIDRDELDVHIADERLEFGSSKSLRRDIEELDLSALGALSHVALFSRCERAVQVSRGNAVGNQRVYLVFHERNQWRDDQCCSSHHERGQLETQRLAPAGRHEHETVLFIKNRANDVFLQWPKIIIPKVSFQKYANTRRSSHGGRLILSRFSIAGRLDFFAFLGMIGKESDYNSMPSLSPADFIDLTPEQRVTLEAFERDSDLCRTFYFIGGTLLKALGIVPRQSNDLDFFTFNTIDARTFAHQRIHFEKILKELFGQDIEATQQGFIHRTRGMLVDMCHDGIPTIGAFVSYGNLATASMDDNVANKASALCSRDELKDLIDIAFLTKTRKLLLKDFELLAERKFGLGTITEEKLLTELISRREQFDVPAAIFLRDGEKNKAFVREQITHLIEQSTL